MSFQTELRAIVVPRTSLELRRSGLSKHLLDGPRYRRTTPGRYVPAVVVPSATQRIVEAAAHMPPGSAVGGWAAAYALGATWLDGLDQRCQPLPVTICLPAILHRATTRSVRYVRRVLPAAALVDVGGISFIGPVRTCVDLACWAPDVVEAVVTLDIVLEAGVMPASSWQDCAAELPGRRGARQARQALGLARAGARSPGETRLRLAYVLGTGAPEPLRNPRVYDQRGRLLGIPDLLDPEAGLVLEYDGSRWTDEELRGGTPGLRPAPRGQRPRGGLRTGRPGGRPR